MKRFVFYLLSSALLLGCNQNPPSPAAVSRTQDTGKAGIGPVSINEQAIYARAFNAVMWGMPAVNSELMHESLLQAKGDYNQVVYWSGRVNSKNQTLTPNPDVIYVNPFYDTRKGPVVLELPAASGVSSITGSIDDSWQTALEDVGTAGVDKGKGGKFLILPPGYKDKIPAGYVALPSAVYTGFAILRSNLTDGGEQDISRAVEYGKRVKVYSLSQAAKPPQTTFVDLLQVPFGNIIPYNMHFFEALNSFVQREPWLTRDMAMVDQLKTIGIEKGKPFNPEARTKELMTKAAEDARIWIDSEYEGVFDPPFYEGTNWAVPAKPEAIKANAENFSDPSNYPTDARAMTYSMAYFSAKHLGSGQFYLMTTKDKDKKPFEGSKSYMLHLPANVPVKLYWSVTAYDRQTHALIVGMPYASRSSTSHGIQKNPDGSVDIYIGPKAPPGKDANWLPVDAKGRFELLARFYGPEKGFFDKSWKMGNVEEIK